MKMKAIKDSKGLMGVGTLIVFIAVILVAAVAATVLISVSSSLQQKSLDTGSQAEEGVATGAEVISVMGTDGATGHDLEKFEIYARLQSGSETMNWRWLVSTKAATYLLLTLMVMATRISHSRPVTRV